jgi:hypothetical protein
MSGDPNRPKTAVLPSSHPPGRKSPLPPNRYMDFLQKVHELMLSVGNEKLRNILRRIEGIRTDLLEL